MFFFLTEQEMHVKDTCVYCGLHRCFKSASPCSGFSASKLFYCVPSGVCFSASEQCPDHAIHAVHADEMESKQTSSHNEGLSKSSGQSKVAQRICHPRPHSFLIAALEFFLTKAAMGAIIQMRPHPS